MLRSISGIVIAILLLALGACDKVGDKLNITGNIAGKVLNADGSGRGYVSVTLFKDGAEVQQQTAEDTGSFFFSKVDGGTYTFKVMAGPGMELPSEPLTVKLGAGKTKQVEIKLLPEQEGS